MISMWMNLIDYKEILFCVDAPLLFDGLVDILNRRKKVFLFMIDSFLDEDLRGV